METPAQETSKLSFKESRNVVVESTANGIVKTYKQLPFVPRILTIIGLILIPISLMINSSYRDTTFHGDYYREGQLIYTFIFGAWTIVSLFGIIRLKQWGLISLVCCKVLDLIFAIIFMRQWDVSWSGIIYSLTMVVVYLCSFMFEESGHSAFEIVKQNGVIIEQESCNK